MMLCKTKTMKLIASSTTAMPAMRRAR